ncbi:hypothetical protein M9M90_01180 [Phenylobacterium sp. LH3H17]|uniref:hypothetical protein n=1 Tax=Phenylobacterium sp. LH3H17 TaxID=2903901 RepID=UPI0020CA15E8|nr:hypothetical protein [Phenylobacterium sp. LH3H17]UTP39817.1 hypothetical protein M9M90_01180 [Phenylobacterium sp. LH3H17]
MSVERPNTVAGLIAKRDDLIKLRNHLEAEARKVTCDIDHLDAVIPLFNPANAPEAIQRYVTKHRARKNHLKRFVIAFLRDNDGFHTSRTITEAWIADRGLRADEATYVILRKRVGACLTVMRTDGLTINGEMDGEYKTWGRAELNAEARAALVARPKFIAN